MSALVIINHVKEGLEMSARHKLCKPLRDTIASHHGTSLVVAFYNRAKQEETKNKPVHDEDFRYPGPLPRTKEAAIIALADSCEAASRSLEKPTPQKINSLISEIFNNRIVDGQLKKADLTMGEVNEIELSIKQNLTTMLHGRVAYPKLKENESNFIETSQKASAAGPAADVAGDKAGDQPKQSGPKIESR
jgi:membrane-associated HD superfamily phosphohydrolase